MEIEMLRSELQQLCEVNLNHDNLVVRLRREIEALTAEQLKRLHDVNDHSTQ